MEHCLTETEYVSGSPEETEALGENITRILWKDRPGSGSVIALKGGLGAGKTCLVKGIARGLGIDETITSPTYTIVNEYQALLNGQTLPLYHIDAYRLNGDEDFENTGAAENLSGQGIAIIEWSERIPRSIPAYAISITIEITGPQSRLFRIHDESACH
jgi:tRNA threonylcarbamoyladenosine biosynthesis protein TsaE